MSTGTPLLAAHDLHRHFGARCAVGGLSLTADRGEVVGLLGPNGAGKSTTMQMLCGALAPSRGRVEICGIDLARNPRQAKRHVGYLPEQPPLYRELLVDDYLDFCGRLHGLRGAALREARERTKDQCGLGQVGGRLVGNLSKGYQQRVGIAQAILHAPEVVVLDEPTVGLDPIQVREIRALVARLRTERCIVLSTHLLAEVQAVCDRVLVLIEGRVALDSPLAWLGGGPARGYRVGLERAPPLAALDALPGVRSAREREDGRIALEVDPERFEPTALAALAVNADWGLTELTPEAPGLEETFVRLVHGEGGGTRP